MVRGSLNTLPTPANKIKWHGSYRSTCSRCGKGGADLKHILNGCIIGQDGGLTPRHNAICHDIYNVIKMEPGANVEIYENKTIFLKTLPPNLQMMRPDLWFICADMEGRQTIEIVEVTVTFATRTKSNQDTLQVAYDFTEDKYKAWREQVQAGTGKAVKQTTVVVSSLGTVSPTTMKALARLLRTKDAARLSKYGRRISFTALEGSLAIWRQFNAHNAKIGNEFEETEIELDEDEAEEVTQEEMRQGINIVAELLGEEEVAAADLVQIQFHGRVVPTLTVKVNKNGTDEMLERRAQKEWRNNWIQLSRKALAPIPRPMHARQIIGFEEVGMEPKLEESTRVVNVTLDWNGQIRNTTLELPLTTKMRPRGQGEADTAQGQATREDQAARLAAREYGAECDV
jgi:hypothetical protein